MDREAEVPFAEGCGQENFIRGTEDAIVNFRQEGEPILSTHSVPFSTNSDTRIALILNTPVEALT